MRPSTASPLCFIAIAGSGQCSCAASPRRCRFPSLAFPRWRRWWCECRRASTTAAVCWSVRGGRGLPCVETELLEGSHLRVGGAQGKSPGHVVEMEYKEEIRGVEEEEEEAGLSHRSIARTRGNTKTPTTACSAYTHRTHSKIAWSSENRRTGEGGYLRRKVIIVLLKRSILVLQAPRIQLGPLLLREHFFLKRCNLGSQLFDLTPLVAVGQVSCCVVVCLPQQSLSLQLQHSSLRRESEC